MPSAEKPEMVTVEIEKGMLKWIECLQAFYDSVPAGTCEFSKALGAKNIAYYTPSLKYTKEVVHLVR